jgi:hypothetical protein
LLDKIFLKLASSLIKENLYGVIDAKIKDNITENERLEREQSTHSLVEDKIKPDFKNDEDTLLSQ